ncbi:unnamed protein product [Callosobruchus maculatus]|uniref:Uncharacterized protein n=1 Tax=Callosobruchus maculatus TaxID=64391 RepID=A0A653BXB5_CALMS|nr:unnamed protein product [Callosobruchus maculatus]
MSLQITGENSFKSALRTLVDFAANRCYKIRMMSSDYMLV